MWLQSPRWLIPKLALPQHVQLVYVSPEMALSQIFQNLWKEASFRKRVTAVIIDEAHCIDEWGGTSFGHNTAS